MTINYEKVAVTEQRPISVTCNMCAKTYNWEEFTGLNANILGGYSSEVIGDGTFVKFDICEHCLPDIMKNFKIKETVGEHLIL